MIFYTYKKVMFGIFSISILMPEVAYMHCTSKLNKKVWCSLSFCSVGNPRQNK